MWLSIYFREPLDTNTSQAEGAGSTMESEECTCSDLEEPSPIIIQPRQYIPTVLKVPTAETKPTNTSRPVLKRPRKPVSVSFLSHTFKIEIETIQRIATYDLLFCVPL